MKSKKTLLAGLIGSMLIAGASNAAVLYSNAWDGSSNAYSSQNDTASFGNFATVYAYMNSGTDTWDISDIHFVGEYFNPPQPGTITGFTINIFQDNGANGIGALVSSAHLVAGQFGEAFVGSVDGYPVFQYDMNIPTTTFAGEGWVSMVPDMAFPPQWGLNSGVDANALHDGYQDFFGSQSRLGTSVNVEITGDVHAVPEPASLSVLGLSGLAMLRRRKA